MWSAVIAAIMGRSLGCSRGGRSISSFQGRDCAPGKSRSRCAGSGRRRSGMKIAIVGGGIGGLTLALSLDAAGIHDVDVYESASSIRALGVGINVQPHAVRELAELGLLDDLYAVGIPTAEWLLASKYGQRIWVEPRGLAAGYRWPQFSIHRGDLIE